MKPSTKTVGWRFYEPVVDDFQEYCDQVNDNYGEAVSAAMVIWRYLPASVQRLAQLEANGIPSVDQKYWEEFRRGLDDAILNQVKIPNGKD